MLTQIINVDNAGISILFGKRLWIHHGIATLGKVIYSYVCSPADWILLAFIYKCWYTCHIHAGTFLTNINDNSLSINSICCYPATSKS